MVYKGYNQTDNFRNFKTIRVFGNEIRNSIVNMSMANDERNHLTQYIKEFNYII